jgi:predicted small lipoprotein YifL
MNRKNLYLSLLLLCALTFLVAACGQRGPLYLPEPAPETPLKDENKDNEEEPSGN